LAKLPVKKIKLKDPKESHKKILNNLRLHGKLAKVTPPGISEELMHKLKAEYGGDKSKAYATAWAIHNHNKKLKKDELEKVAYTPAQQMSSQASHAATQAHQTGFKAPVKPQAAMPSQAEHASRAASFADFMPSPSVGHQMKAPSQGPRLPKMQAVGKSEKWDFGSCALCGRPEHSNECI
jgi:hypothetical protein